MFARTVTNATKTINGPTPKDLEITPRDRRFGRGQSQKRWWLANDPFATAFYNALSVTFPKGEAFFVESVKAFREGVPPKLDAEVRAFISQEVMHSREHVAFNRGVFDAGYDVSRLEAKIVEMLDLAKGRPQIVNLAATMALEHYTATLAKQLLENPAHLAGADQEQADLWRWHAIEEIEHKGVAHDVWMHATRDWSRWQRWKVKSLVMVLVSKNFWVHRYNGVLDLLAQDGITGWAAHKGILKLWFGNPGMVRKLIPELFAYFMPGFHPWNTDDRALINKAESDYAEARLPETLEPALAA
jgi:uncharacterized protein